MSHSRPEPTNERVDARCSAEDAWFAAFDEVARIAGAELDPPHGWAAREAQSRHVCDLLREQLDSARFGSSTRSLLARAYARAFALLVEAGRRRAETVRPSHTPR